MKIKNILILLFAIGIFVPLSYGQYTVHTTDFTVHGIINPGDENIEGWLSADITVDFMNMSGIVGNTVNLVRVTTTNTSNIDSKLDAFYLQKPAPGITPSMLGTSNPDNWILDSNGSEQFQQFQGNWDMTNYFGGHAGTRLDDSGPSGVFYFVFDDFTFTSYGDVQSPIMFVKWQAVNTPCFDEGSGKGSTAVRFGTPVPEPSIISLLGVFGVFAIMYGKKLFVEK